MERERESKGRGWVKSPSRKVSWTKKLFGLVRSLGRSSTGLASKPQAGISPLSELRNLGGRQRGVGVG